MAKILKKTLEFNADYIRAFAGLPDEETRQKVAEFVNKYLVVKPGKKSDPN